MTGFSNYDNKDGSWGGPSRDAVYNSFGGRSDRSKTAFFNDRGAGSRGRCVKLAFDNILKFLFNNFSMCLKRLSV